MENAAEALKIAFAVALFVMALTLSMSSFSQAMSAVQAITTMRDRELEYTYVKPTEEFSRFVGIETVVSSIYRAYEENLEIYFYQGSLDNPLYIYKIGDEPTNCIDLAHEGLVFGDSEEANQFLNALMGGQFVSNWDDVKDKYENTLMDGETDNGLYKKYSNATFEERTGEYIQYSGTSETTQRIITYILQ